MYAFMHCICNVEEVEVVVGAIVSDMPAVKGKGERGKGKE